MKDNDPAATIDSTKIAAPEASAPIDSPSIEIVDDWRELHWKTRVGLAKAIRGTDEAMNADDANTIIANEVARRAVVIDDEGLVAVTKDGETLHVHPTAVTQHQKLGWELV